MRPILAACICSLALTPCAAAVTKTAPPLRAGTLTPEMVVATRAVGDVSISPDARLVAYVVSVPRTPTEKPGGPFQEIWIVPTSGGQARQYTPSRLRSWAPAFSPDGATLAFLSVRGEKDAGSDETTDLFVLPVAGGEAERVSDGKLSVNAFRWSPDGGRIAFSAKEPKSDAEKKEIEAGRDQVVSESDLRPRRLWLVDVTTGTISRVTQDDSNVLGFDWSPDGSRLALRTTATPRVDDDYVYSSLTLVPPSGGVPAALVQTRGKLGTPDFSPSGKYVAWLGATDLNDPFAGSVFVAPAVGGTPVEITRGHTGVATAIDWKDDETVVVAATRSTETVLALVPRRGGSARVVASGGPVFTEMSLSRAGSQVALAASTPACPSEVYTASLERRATRLRRLTTTNPQIESVQLGSQESVRWKASDGLEIAGVLIKPIGWTASRRDPLVVVVHGGPESCYRNGWVTSHGSYGQLLAHAGYVVFYPNYRGSIGRDEAFERADHGDLMGAEFGDVLSGVDALVARGLVDPDRVGIAGGSYGGYTTAWAATAHSPRFAAAIDFAGITNWLSMQGTSDIPEENALVHWNRPFYANMDLYWQRSPLAHVNDCRTPLLLLHGEKDARVPISQGQELYTALRLLGRDVEFVRYPREEHGLKEAAHQLDMTTRSLAWFDRWLKPAPGSVTSRR